MLLCANCLAKETAAQPAEQKSRRWMAAGMRFAITAGSAVLLWLVFYALGQFLKKIPADLHEGTIWRVAGF